MTDIKHSPVLNQKQVKSLPEPGWYPNHVLRRINPNHGHIVPARTVGDKTHDESDVEFVGNRSQYKFRMRNPLKKLKSHDKDKFQSNRFKTEKSDWFSKTLSALAKLFKFLNFGK